jgi:hypothetical protein
MRVAQGYAGLNAVSESNAGTRQRVIGTVIGMATTAELPLIAAIQVVLDHFDVGSPADALDPVPENESRAWQIKLLLQDRAALNG